MTVLIRKGDGGWAEPTGSGYDSEAAMQALIFDHPTVLPGITGEPAVAREFQSGVGPADLIVLDSEGQITVVECKLDANPEVRRKIVGQVLDYGSRLAQMSVEQFEQAWIKADADSRSPFAYLEDSDGRIRAAVQDNLREARFNLVLAVDAINEDLERIVTYLNKITRPTTGVMVVEFTRLHDEGIEILMPRAYGVEQVEAKNDSGDRLARPRWTIDEYLDWVDTHDPAGAPVMHALVQALQEAGFGVYGGRAATPSLNCGIDVPGMGRKYPVCLYTDPVRGGLVELRFSDFRRDPILVREFADRVCAIDGVPLEASTVVAADYRKRPSIPVRDFTPASVRTLARQIAAIGHDPAASPVP